MSGATTLRRAMPADAQAFPEIEQSAGERFREVEDLAWIADSENLTGPRYADLIACGASWLAEAEDGRPLGFLCAEVMDADLHIHELAVVFDRQGMGIGRSLLETAVAWAADEGLEAITLTTFRDVAWNEPFYRRAGFETLPEAHQGQRLASIMATEIGRGLPAERRCAMRRSVG